MTEEVYKKTHEAYIGRLKKSIETPFKLYEMARFIMPIKPLTKGQESVIKMFASTNDKIMRKRK